MTIRTIFIMLAMTFLTTVSAQKPQRIGYIDMDYILRNIPEYQEAQARLKQKVDSWQQKLNDIQDEINTMKTSLANEKPLLTDDIVSEREEDIQIREEDLKKLQAAYFGPTGDEFLLRKQLVKPIQDQVYNSVQEIAVKKNYDMILDKSSDLIMLYSNNKYDVSDLVLSSIVKGWKKAEVEERASQRQEAIQEKMDENQQKMDDKAQKRKEMQDRIKAQQEERARLREEAKQRAADERQKRIDAVNNRKNNAADEKAEVKQDTTSAIAPDSAAINTKSANSGTTIDSLALKKADSIQNARDSVKDSKRAALLEKIRLQQEAKAKLREEQKQAAEEARKKRLEEIEKRKKLKEEQKENNN